MILWQILLLYSRKTLSNASLNAGIKIHGTGCPSCIRLENMCREVVAENNLDATIEKVTKVDDFWKYGVMLTPALIINGRLLVQGKLPTRHTFVHWLMENE